MSEKMTPEQTPKAGGETPRMRRGLRVLLVVSVTLNLLIVGLAVGMALSGGPAAHHGSRFPAHVRALEHEDRRALGRAIRSAYREGRLGKRSEKRYEARLADLLEATPFDRVAVAALQREMKAAEMARFDAARQIWLDRVATMSDAERAAYAERLRVALTQKERK